MSAIDTVLAALIPSSLALSLARRLMKSAGLGHGGIVARSGEMKAAAAALARAGIRTRDPVLFDVGGNVGEWTLAAKRTWPSARVHVFEPSASHLETLRPALASLEHVTVNPVALGAEAGQATLYKDADITGLASMTKRDLAHVGLSMDLSEAIEVDTLDAYCARHGITSIDMLKIDVEGHELDVLKGAAAMLDQRSVAVVQFEFGGCNVDTRTFFRDFYDFFDARGYRLFIAGPGGRLTPVRRYREFNEQFLTTNYIAIRT
ncbi:MAG: FkbM family methyltransferase [Hoeflea sp.]|uniref:FkbM family methyltransferase n=1 Tax=Hoeflea sp. TaxID=1940281 RepID=UPI002731CFF7|nr:FkbM family methyltransferase [Hoeflea sp.]MDP2120199.1 FkbM family methyltransferase [Hoeflea sp.]